MSRRRAGLWVLAVGVGLVALATLQPVHHWGPPGDPEALGAADRLANVILFLPVGLGLGLARVRWWKALLAGALISTGVEVAQLLIPGRFTNPWDVAMNSAGAALGVGLPWLLCRPPGWRPASLGVGAAAAVLLGQAWLAQPVAQHAPFAVRFRPPASHGRWAGALHTVSVGGTALWAGPFGGPEPGLVGAGWPLRLTLTAPGPTPADLPLFEIRSGRDRAVVQLSARAGALGLRFGDRGVALGFGGTALDGLAPLLPGPHTLRLQSGHDGLCLTVDEAERCGLGPSVARGWVRIHQLAHPPGWLLALLDGLWMIGLGGLVGLWAPSRRWVTGAGAALITVGVYAVAHTGLAGPPGWALALAVSAAFAAAPVWRRLGLTSWASPAS